MNWLRGELAPYEGPQRLTLARREREDAEAMRMSAPVSNAEAFTWFGAFLGLFPPAAMFSRVFDRGINSESDQVALAFCVVMTTICCAAGRAIGGRLGGRLGNPRERAWGVTLLTALLLGLVWGLATGGAGGAIVFGIGAVFGAFCALPVALVGFPAFMLLHRPLSRGGMIEERHLWPLAFGVPSVIAAVILSPSDFAY